MAKTSPELLTDILGVLGQINSKIGTTQKQQAPQADKSTKMAAGGGGINMNQFAEDKTKTSRIRDTADAMKILSSALNSLSWGMLKFGLVPNAFKRSTLKFIADLMKLMKGNIVDRFVPGVKNVTEGLQILADSLPKLSKGIFMFGVMEKMGLVTATAKGIEVLMQALKAAGKVAADPYVMAAVLALAGLGVALQGIAAVMKSVALVMLSFAASVAMMVGTLWLASKLFGVGPMEAMLIVMGSMAILAAGFALIGLMGPLILGAGVAIAAMGIGLLLAGIGLLGFMGSFALMNMMTGSQEATDAALWSGAKTLVIMGLVFAGLGIIGGLIKRGGVAVQEMGKGLLWAAGGILAMGAVGALFGLMGVDMVETAWQTGKSLLILGGTFALLGLFAPLILLGVASIVAISVGIILFALVSLGVGAVIKLLGGEKGLKTMSNNITLLVSGVLIGVINGISQGLLGEDGDSKGFFGKIFTVGKNVMILIGGIFLLMLVSYALIMFATSLYAFQKVGIIKDAKGRDINVVNTATNIATSIGTFFKTLTSLFKNKNIIPDEKEMETITRILLGKSTGFKLLGIRVVGEQKPGLIDAIAKFGQVLMLFAKAGQIPQYEVDAKGNPKQTGFVKTVDIAKNIVSTLKSFFVAFKGEQSALDGISADVGSKLSLVLLGSKWTGALGWVLKGVGLAKDQPGLLEPIMKFSEMILQYAKMGANNQVATEFDANGKPIGWKSTGELATNIVKGVISFLQSFRDVMADNYGTFDKLSESMPNATEVFTKALGNLNLIGTTSLTGIDKLSVSLGTLADNIGRLTENMARIDTGNLSKLASEAGNFETKFPNAGKAKAPAAADWGNQQQAGNADLEMLAQKIADKINTSKNGTFDFIFHDTNKGKIEVVFK